MPRYVFDPEKRVTHGFGRSGKRRRAEYRAYHHAKNRCNNPKDKGYKYYGGRGIEFRFTSFEEFIAHIGPRPSPKHSLDRIDNDGHYEPGNVRWATKEEQMCNLRRSIKADRIARIVELRSHGFTYQEIEEELGVPWESAATVCRRERLRHGQ